MVNDQKQRAEAIFHAALEIKSDDERSTYLDKACENDLKMRNEVDELLEAHQDSDDFMKSPPFIVQLPSNAFPEESPGTTIGNYKLLATVLLSVIVALYILFS